MRRRIVLSVLVVVAILGAQAAYIQLTTNFHTVLPGKLYRSAQPQGEQIARWHQRYGIKTIINLRGAHPTEPWYQAERAVTESLGIRLIDYKMSAELNLPPERVKELIATMAGAETPILIHCNGGADRSGLASAIYIAAIAHGTEAYAEFQLTPYYGHLPLWFISYYAMDHAFEAAEPLLGFPDS